MKNFALVGVGGYIAPRHMQAIRETGNRLVAAVDPNDSVGIMDSHFPDAEFFTEFERFDRHIDALKRKGQPEVQVDYVSICSPNYLHDSHLRFALRSGTDAICEKPLVLTIAEIEELVKIEQDTGQKVNTILQLRLHPAIIGLREKIAAASPDRKFYVELTYVTSRGKWYFESWKGENAKSGGIATNIGVHFFDMLFFLFGPLVENQVHLSTPAKTGGYLEFERANVRWFLSLDIDVVPTALREVGQRTYRSITIDGDEIEFSGGFTDLHTRSYEEILAGRGFGLADNRTAITAVEAIRSAPIVKADTLIHPYVAKALK